MIGELYVRTRALIRRELGAPEPQPACILDGADLQPLVSGRVQPHTHTHTHTCARGRWGSCAAFAVAKHPCRLSLRLEILGALITFSAAIFAVIKKGEIDSGPAVVTAGLRERASMG